MRLHKRCARIVLSTASLPPSCLENWKVLVGGHPVPQLSSDRLEVGRASELFGAEA
jgi:hypothetical protein